MAEGIYSVLNEETQVTGSPAGAQVTVDTNLVQAQAAKVRNLLNGMQSAFAETDRIVRRTGNYWEGEASELYRQEYMIQLIEVQQMLARLLRFPAEMEQIAGIYAEAEEAAKKSLPTDIL